MTRPHNISINFPQSHPILQANQYFSHPLCDCFQEEIYQSPDSGQNYTSHGLTPKRKNKAANTKSENKLAVSLFTL